jgi:hypothetical protein
MANVRGFPPYLPRKENQGKGGKLDRFIFSSQSPKKDKSRSNQRWLTETAFSFFLTPAVQHQASPRNSKELIKQILFFYSITSRQVKRKHYLPATACRQSFRVGARRVL